MVYKVTEKDLFKMVFIMVLLVLNLQVITGLFSSSPTTEIEKLNAEIEQRVNTDRGQTDGNPLYCLISDVTDNPYDKQLWIYVMEETVVNDEKYIQYKFSRDQRGLSNNSRDWFSSWSNIDCSKLKD